MTSSTGLTQVQTAILAAIVDDAGIERPLESTSRLVAEAASSSHPVERHFLEQLPHQCTLLAIGVADALGSLARLSPELPFGAVVLARALLECAADLYWLSDQSIDGGERARRAFLIYIKQHETVTRQLEQVYRRVPVEIHGIQDLPRAIDEGWESLRRHAEEMAAAGHQLRTTTKPGSKYVIGDAKPSISALIDRLITDHLGKTGLDLYANYSPVAHGEGEGLGSLLTRSDAIETPLGVRYRHGFDEETWRKRIKDPAVGAAREQSVRGSNSPTPAARRLSARR